MRAGFCGSGRNTMIGKLSAIPKPIVRITMATRSRRVAAMHTGLVVGLDTNDFGARGPKYLGMPLHFTAVSSAN
jgi:cell division septal protein FtsQ